MSFEIVPNERVRFTINLVVGDGLDTMAVVELFTELLSGVLAMDEK